MQELKLSPATEKDIDSIASLAKQIWNAYYPPIIGQQQVDYMLAQMYSRESLYAQMKSRNDRFYLIENQNDLLGFISVHQEKEPGDWFLNKFYISQSWAGKGIGKASFRQLLQTLHPKQISLTVNRGNYKAINFYFSLGFRIDSCTQIDIGNGFMMDDFVMVWKAPGR